MSGFFAAGLGGGMLELGNGEGFVLCLWVPMYSWMLKILSNM